ncbi:MAG: ATP-binding protein [Oscillospiraceae bacterium]|nr:ATP-binding protein [Oscillospiraceae bacterium]
MAYNYNGEVIKKVLGDFENKYKSALLESMKRQKELQEKIPELSDIEKELSETYKDISYVMLGSRTGGDFEEKLAAVKEKNLDLQKKRKSLIIEAGYGENYAEPVYQCKLCGDTGYKSDGILCRCLKKALIAESINNSGFGKIIKEQTFKNFNLDYYGGEYGEMKEVYDFCRKFAGKYPDVARKHLLFIGPTGLGKTHLSSAIAGEIINKGRDVYYNSARSILYSFEKERFSHQGSFDAGIIERYMTCDLLIIDDLGTEYRGNTSASSLYNLINMRLIDGKNMIINTNLTAKEIWMKYDPRIASRMFGEFKTLNFTGEEDIRIKKLK